MVDEQLFTQKERQILQRLQADGSLTDAHIAQVQAIHRKNKTPLLSILGALNIVDPKDYAAELAEVEETGYLGALMESEYFNYDEKFIRRFDAAVCIRYLFFPVQQIGEMVTVLAVNPDEPIIETTIRQVVPDADIITMVVTEKDITNLMKLIYQDEYLDNAVNLLRRTHPGQSASRVFTRVQIGIMLLTAVLLLVGFITNFWTTARLLIVLFSVLYIIGIAYKFMLSLTGIIGGRRHVAEKHIDTLDDADLPIYSILVPVYKEPEVVPRLLKALSRIDYPQEKLDVLLLMESDDEETIEMAKAAKPPRFFRFIIVPDSLPRTKPKACNYGLNFCRGEFVTIYDAEDIPDPDQLKKAVYAFRNGSDRLICVQAQLNYFNSGENYLTRMFTLEYTYWFDYLLPGLDRLRLPIPLGGTSNHFRLNALWQLGAWDPFNVTEDADLGIRASAEGYTVGVISSTTYEEANKRVKNWIRQRSRWIKGYMQTWLVHNRNPLRLIRQIGIRNWLSYQFFIGGTFGIFLINPLMWMFFIIWLLFQPDWMGVLFEGWVWEISIFSLVVGNTLAIFLNMLASFGRRHDGLLVFSLTNPLYWVLHSIAAYMALWQLFTKPFYWEKTQHGLTEVEPDDALFDSLQGAKTAAGSS